MKSQKIILLVSFVLAIFVSSGLVSALDTSALSATPVFSKNTLNIGSSVTVRITVQSNTDEQLSIIHVGINFDWMPSGRFAGPDLSNNPAVIESKGSYTTAPFIVPVPTNVTLGSHDYFVGVDGTDSNNQEFYWNSSTTSIIVLAANQTGTTITPGPTGGGGGGGQTTISSLTLILYFAVAAIAVVIVVAVIVIVIMKRRKKRKPTEPTNTAPPVVEQPTKPTKPAEEENYSI